MYLAARTNLSFIRCTRLGSLWKTPLSISSSYRAVKCVARPAEKRLASTALEVGFRKLMFLNSVVVCASCRVSQTKAAVEITLEANGRDEVSVERNPRYLDESVDSIVNVSEAKTVAAMNALESRRLLH